MPAPQDNADSPAPLVASDTISEHERKLRQSLAARNAVATQDRAAMAELLRELHTLLAENHVTTAFLLIEHALGIAQKTP